MMDEETAKFIGKVNEEYQFLQDKYGDVNNKPCILQVHQNHSALYLNTQLVDLLLIINIQSPEEYAHFVTHCVQLLTNTITPFGPEQLEQKKRELFKSYIRSFIPYRLLAIREGYNLEDSYRDTYKLNFEKNLPNEYHADALEAFKKRGEKGLITYLSSLPDADKIMLRIQRYVSRDFGNVHSLSYEEVLQLDQLIKRDVNIDTLVTLGASYELTMRHSSKGTMEFDPYYLDRMLKYCKICNKHMRYLSLYDRHVAVLFSRKGLDKEGVMESFVPFTNGYFYYLNKHNETLSDGSRIINSAVIFNELLTYDETAYSGGKTGLVWRNYFGMSMKDLYYFIFKDGQNRIPEGVSVMYNERSLEEGEERLGSAERILKEVLEEHPNFINVYGTELHLNDDLFQPENYHYIQESVVYLKKVQDEYHIPVEITENDLFFHPDLIIKCDQFGISRDYIKLLKINYLEMLSKTFNYNNLKISRVGYWTIFDRLDHNFIKVIEEKLFNTEDISGLDSLNGGLIPYGADIDSIQKISE